MDTEGKRLWSYLSQFHRGRDNANTAGNLGVVLQIGGLDGVGVRDVITRNLEAFPGFVAACSHGFFVAHTGKEIADYLADLDGRCAGLEHRRLALRRAAVALGWVENEGMWERNMKEHVEESAGRLMGRPVRITRNDGSLFEEAALADGRNEP